MTSKVPELSTTARQQLERELEQLRHQRASTVAPVGEEDAAGDSADRADLLQRAETAAWLDRRIAEVTDLLAGRGPARAEPDDAALPEGTNVTVRFGDGEEETLRVVSLAAAEDLDVVTRDSPLGKALSSSAVGDTVTYRTPVGDQSVTVLAIAPPA